MATANPFDILGDDDGDDPATLIAKQELKNLSKKAVAAPAPAATAAASKFPSKPAPPAQAAKDVRSSSAQTRGGSSRGGGFRGGRGNRDYGTRDLGNREFKSPDKPNGFSAPAGGEERGANERAPHQQSYRSGPRRGGEESDRAPRRTYERHSGTGRGFEVKRDGSGRGNWGSASDEPPVQEGEETVKSEEKEKVNEGEVIEEKENKEEVKEEEPEDKEMTLEEYEKVREEKRKSLLAAIKTEERKVEVDKDLQSMQKLSTKKTADPIFIKLGSEKDLKKKDAEKDERAKKVVSINEFLKPAEGERGGFGGRRGGRGGRGQMRGGYSGGSRAPTAAPAIEDPSQFPTLGGPK